MPRLTYSQAQTLLNRYRDSGLSQLAFRKKYNISTSLFAYWLPKCYSRPSKPTPAFQEIILPDATPSHAHCTLCLPNGLKLEFPVGHLDSVIAALTNGKREC
jgi:hypothetical protein